MLSRNLGSRSSGGFRNTMTASYIRLLHSTAHLLAFAVRRTIRRGYTKKDFLSDLCAGCVVALIAIPLGLALAIASGVPPQNGIYTIIVAGFIVAALGGSKQQVTGPTAAFVVILVPIVNKFGISGLLTAGFMAGILLAAMGILRLGGIVRFIPTPVVTGFTSGIAVVIATIQIKDFFGLTIEHMPESYFGKVEALIGSISTFSVVEFSAGIMTLLALVAVPRFSKKIPAPLLILPAISILVYLANRYFPGVHIATIGSRFSYSVNGSVFPGIPAILPDFALPWSMKGGQFSIEMLRQLFPSAVAIALLGAIESLLSAVVADGMAGTRHNPDSELLGLGIGNMVAPFFGGIPATGAIARTATNVRFGGRSPFSAMIHAVFTLLALLILAPALSLIPMAAMAALLLLVAYNMSEAKHFMHVLKRAPTSDVFVMVGCFFATVLVDMVAGISFGVLFAGLLFTGRMARLTDGHVLHPGARHEDLLEAVPEGVVVYDINGALFFGAARAATEAISSIENPIKALILSFDDVITSDFSGFLEIETAISLLKSRGVRVIICGLHPQPKQVFEKGGIFGRGIEVASSLRNAIDILKAEDSCVSSPIVMPIVST